MSPRRRDPDGDGPGSSAPARSRAGTRKAAGPVVAVTAASGPAGRAVTAALGARVGARGGPREVIAIDRHGSLPDGTRADNVTWRTGDVTAPEVVSLLTGADVVVHLAAADDLAAALATSHRKRRADAVRAVQTVTTAAAAAGAGLLVVVTSAMIYGARPDNPVPLADDDERRAGPDDGLVGDMLEIERILERTPRVHPGLSVCVVRPAALAGGGADTVVSRHFEAPRLLVVRGSHSLWQFCHVEDLGTAVAEVIRHGVTGAVTVGCDGALEEEDVERISGMRRVEVPSGLAFGTAERLHRVGVLPMPATDLSYVVHPWVVGSTRLLERGWTAQHDNSECLAELLKGISGRHAVAGRRMDRRDAALGAAGAAVALLGTAAVLRQARVRQARGRQGRPDAGERG